MKIKMDIHEFKTIMQMCSANVGHDKERPITHEICIRLYDGGRGEAVALDGYTLGAAYFRYDPINLRIPDDRAFYEFLMDPIVTPQKCDWVMIEDSGAVSGGDIKRPR